MPKPASRRAIRGALIAGLLALVALGTPAEAFDLSGLERLDGSAATQDDASKNVVFVFFTSWSPRCRGIVARANRLEREWGDRAQIVLVNFQEDRAAVERFMSGEDVEVEVLLDRSGAFSKRHGITYLPSLLAVKDDATAFRGKFPRNAGPLLEPIYE